MLVNIIYRLFKSGKALEGIVVLLIKQRIDAFVGLWLLILPTRYHSSVVGITVLALVAKNVKECLASIVTVVAEVFNLRKFAFKFSYLVSSRTKCQNEERNSAYGEVQEMENELTS